MLDKIRHIFNPLHVMCRLHQQFGLSIKKAMVIVQWYEVHIYQPLLGKEE